MNTKIIIAFVFSMLTTFMPMRGWDNTGHLAIEGSQGNNSGASIFEAYDETKSMKQRFERLDGLALYLKENPSFQAYVISYGGRSSCRREALRRARFAQDYLFSVKSIDRKRVTALDGGYLDKWEVVLWIGAQGEPPPVPMPTVNRRSVKIMKNCKPNASTHKKHGS